MRTMPPIRSLAVAVLCGCTLHLAARGEIIDRVAVRVGNGVITDSDIQREIRLTAYLNGERPQSGPAERRAAAERLVDQRLMRRDVEALRYPEAEPDDVEKLYRDTIAARGPAIDAGDLKAHLRWQLTMLRFIGMRFRTGVLISDAEIEKYAAKLGVTADLAQHRAKLEQTLIEERANQQAEDWLKEARKQTLIEFRPEAFQ